jgi:hypothetical protein
MSASEDDMDIHVLRKQVTSLENDLKTEKNRFLELFENFQESIQAITTLRGIISELQERENQSLRRMSDLPSRQSNIIDSPSDKLGKLQITKEHIMGHTCSIKDQPNNNISARCAICLRDYVNDELLYWYHPDPTQSSCYHTVHYACSKKWLG